MGALISRDVNDRVLLGIFALIALVTAAMLCCPLESQQTGTDDLHLNVPLAVSISIVLGFLAEWFGIGGDRDDHRCAWVSPARPAAHRDRHLAWHRHVRRGRGTRRQGRDPAQIDPPLAAIVAVVALIASPIGAWVSIRRSRRSS